MDFRQFIKILKSNGFKKVPWNRCPQGFEQSNYQCFEHVERNIWAELYLSDAVPYGWIIGSGIPKTEMMGGSFFDNPNKLQKLITFKPMTNETDKKR